MSRTRFITLSMILSALCVLFGSQLSSVAVAQYDPASPLHFAVSGESQRIEMTVKTSRMLTLPYNVPELLVQNPDVVQASPRGPNKILLNAKLQGATTLNVWDEGGQVHTIDIRVFGDVRQLQEKLGKLFPDATIKTETLESSLLLSGHVTDANDVNRIVQIAREYFPKVINHMTVGGVQTVALHVKVVEVSRTKLRQFGIDWSVITGGDTIVQTVSGITAPTLRFNIVNGGTNLTALLDLLRQNSMAKLLAEPTVVTTSGRPASFNSGGEIPIPLSGGLGVTTVEYREFGTTVDFVPIVLGNGKIKLEVRPQVTEIDPSLKDDTTGTPGFRSRRVDTSVEMEPGQTLALAGLIQSRVEAENKGLPWLADIPFFGVPFRRVEDRVNEVELLILVTPQIVAPMEPHEVPPCGPGELTTSPNDVELYLRGYSEVPKCCFDGSCLDCRSGAGAPTEFERIERIPPAENDNEPPAIEGAAPSAARGQLHLGSANQVLYPRTASRPPVVTRVGDVAPVHHRAPQNRDNPQRPTFKPAKSKNIPPVRQPKLFGPIGYDVIN